VTLTYTVTFQPQPESFVANRLCAGPHSFSDHWFLSLLITVGEGIQFLWLAVSSRAELSAEVLFLRKQLAFYREHQVPPRKLTDAARFSLVLWSQLFHWKAALMIVKPETLIGWHRKGFKLFWRRKSRLGRPRIPEVLRQLIVRMVRENPTWGEERIAAELSVKLGILVSPRTVRAYWPQDRDPRGGGRTASQHWRTFVRNHAKALVAADFLVAITAGFRVLYVFVVMEVGSRRILHCHVTAHPTAAWTLQQFREAIPSDHIYRFLIHDRDSIFSAEVDDQLGAFGLKILRTPVQAPKANAYASHCTSFEHCGRTEVVGRRRHSLTPCAFLGMLGPTGSYRCSGLSV
jgi:putative transposase